MIEKLSVTFVILILLFSCSKEDTNIVDSGINPPNILLIIADDLGKDAINGYAEGSIKPATPNIDAIRKSGLTFTNFWVYPTCTPTRSSIITGKYGYRTGVKWAGDILNNTEEILHHYIKEQTNNQYQTALIGKWHLAGNVNTTFNPEVLGMDYYAGLLSGTGDYSAWNYSEDGVVSVENEYITKKLTTLAKDWINNQTKPWFLWLAYTAPHTPFHIPPNEMHSQGNLPEYIQGIDPIPYYMAAIEAMDFQIGRLLENISKDVKENTIIIFIGDNGTPNQVAQIPYTNDKAKGSLYQGGINTPMFISGAGVNRQGVDNNLINGTDLFATIASLSGINVDVIYDSKSFTSLLKDNIDIRKFQYSEMSNEIDEIWTISNGTYKLIENKKGNIELFDLLIDPYEEHNLIGKTLNSNEIDAKQELENELLKIRN
ncbi:sulfatase-like hydrolase/transferase [Tenacibaculum sp. C7A-26P2]|uniref:sulfatase-like hydrolase/transferase n=1 Tax=Tenacibaculum sp. C7A-26P2 TaxID=3447504 RepID=UPI003F864AE0